MARNRRKTATPTTNTNTGEKKMAGGLTPEQIAQLLAGTRTKGDYVVKLNQFVESGDAGDCVNTRWPEFAEKKSATLKQGFENAKTNKEAVDGAENVKVLVNEDKVYLINLTAVEVPEADEDAA